MTFSRNNSPCRSGDFPLVPGTWRLAALARGFFLVLGVLFLGGCATSKIPGVYRIDIPQGNVVTQRMLDQIELGMDKRKVRFFLGTPLLTDTFHQERWDYYYSLKRNGEQVAQQRISLFFKDDRLAVIDGGVDPANLPVSASGEDSLLTVPPKRPAGLFGFFGVSSVAEQEASAEEIIEAQTLEPVQGEPTESDDEGPEIRAPQNERSPGDLGDEPTPNSRGGLQAVSTDWGLVGEDDDITATTEQTEQFNFGRSDSIGGGYQEGYGDNHDDSRGESLGDNRGESYGDSQGGSGRDSDSDSDSGSAGDGASLDPLGVPSVEPPAPAAAVAAAKPSPPDEASETVKVADVSPRGSARDSTLEVLGSDSDGVSKNAPGNPSGDISGSVSGNSSGNGDLESSGLEKTQELSQSIRTPQEIYAPNSVVEGSADAGS